MDFSTLPPEIDSARMYSGPGSGPLMAAATAWDQLGHRIGLHGELLLVGDFGAHRRGVAGSFVGVDGGRGRALCGLDEHYRRTGQQAAAQATAAVSASMRQHSR